MKKYVSIFLYLILCSLLSTTYAQNADSRSDSSKTRVTHANSLLEKDYLNKPIDLHHFGVRAGDTIRYSVELFDHNAKNGKVWRNLSKAIIPTVTIGKLANQGLPLSGEQKQINPSTVGVGATITPSAIALLTSRERSKTFIGMIARDSSGHDLVIKKSLMTRAARKNWQTLTVSYVAEKDGFVEFVTNVPNKTQVALNNGQVSITRAARESAPNSNPNASDPSTGPVTNGMESAFCVLLIRTEYIGGYPISSQIVSFECFNAYTQDPSGEQAYAAECGACKRAQKDALLASIADYNQKMFTAASDRKTAAIALVAAVGGCFVAGGGTFLRVTEAGLIVMVIPGVGEVTEAGLALVGIIGGMIVAGGCSYAATNVYLNALDHIDSDVTGATAALANARASYETNMIGCGNCPNP